MNVVDSSGWLEYFTESSNSDFFAPAIENSKSLLIPTLCIFEVFKKVLREKGEDAALEMAGLMQQGTVIELTLPVSLLAANLGLAHKLPTADSLILASARHHQAALWTQDSDFKGLEGVKYIEKK